MTEKFQLVGVLERVPEHFTIVRSDCCPTITGTIRQFGDTEMKKRYSYLEVQQLDARGDCEDVVDSWSRD